MSSCCSHKGGTRRLFSSMAGRYVRRFDAKGLEKTQQQLLDGVQAAGIQGASLLDIGCGTGFVHQSLLQSGAGAAVGIDIADEMIAAAASQAKQRGLEARTEYLTGDFVDLADELQPADITLLDKVICCYPDAQGLVAASLSRTRRVYAITIPRDRWYCRLFVRLLGAWMAVHRCDFRAFVHDPEHVSEWVEGAGYARTFEATTCFWLTRVFVKPAGAAG